MAITNASTLAEYASGIGTQNSTLTVDSGNKRVGVGTTNPLGTFQVGSGVTFWGDAGIGSFTSLKLSGDTDSTSISTGALTVTGGVGIGLSLTVGGDVSVGGTITYEDVTNVDSIGIVTARSGLRVVGGGITCVGVATFFSDIDANGALDVDGQTDLDVLNVAEIATFAADVSIADKIIHTGDTNTAIRFPSNDIVSVETAGSERVRITAAGNVNQTIGDNAIGFNQTAAGNHYVKNVVNANRTGADAIILALHSQWNSTDVAAIKFRGGSDTTNKDDGYITFETSSADDIAERLRIDSSGSVGIGTNDPSWGLSGNGGLIVGDGGSSQAITIFSGSSNSGDISFGDATSGTARYSGLIRYDHNGDYMAFRTATTERLRITSAGKVGIATTNPVGNLEIRDSSKANLIVAKDGLTVKNNSDLASNYDFLQIGAGGALASYNVETATASTYLIHNAYRDTSNNWNYRYADTSMRLRMNSPGRAFIFESAASGSANANITYSEYLRIKSDGDIRAGDANNTWVGDRLEIAGTKEGVLGLANYGSTASEAGIINFYRSISGTVGTDTVPTGNIGGLTFRGWSGDAYQICASIGASTDGTWNSSGDTTDTPGKLTFSTTPDGSSACAERLRIDSDGRLLIGDAATATNTPMETFTSAQLQLCTTGGGTIILGRNDTSVAADNYIGGIYWDVNDSTSNAWNETAKISIDADDAHANGDYPSRMAFHTCADGAATVSERLRIDSSGNVSIGGIAPVATDAAYNKALLHIHQTQSGTYGSELHLTNNTTGSTATDGMFLSMWTDSDVYFTNQESGDINFTTNGHEALKIQSNKNVKITDGNLIIDTSGHGIDFSATAGTGDSELLDDYERGAFTPTVGGSTTAGTVNYSAQQGYYVKIGRVVHCWFDVTISSASGMGGVWCINNLPFTKAFLGSQSYYYEGGSFWNVGDTLSDTKPCVAGYIPNSTTKFLLYSADTMGTKTTLVLNTAGRVSGMVSYTPTT